MGIFENFKKSIKCTAIVILVMSALLIAFVIIVPIDDTNSSNESFESEHYWNTFDFKINKELDSVSCISYVEYDNESKNIIISFGGYTTRSKFTDVCKIMKILNSYPDDISEITLVSSEMLYGLDGNGEKTIVIQLQVNTETSKNVDFEEIQYFENSRLLEAMYYNFDYCYIHPAILKDYHN